MKIIDINEKNFLFHNYQNHNLVLINYLREIYLQ